MGFTHYLLKTIKGMESPLGNWFQNMIKRHGDKGCCEECYVPEKDGDYILPSGHSVVTAYPESCKDEECECHLTK